MNYEKSILADSIICDYAYKPDVDFINAKRYLIDLDNRKKCLPQKGLSARDFAAHLERKDNNQRVKTLAIEKRRREFQHDRPIIMLQMLESGLDYVCCVDNCGESEFLTVDHKTPLSRGGSDDLENLQFMCKSHNSKKGDR